jgi:medium-chain acyl-[acyl-carrier-protein] hydrolase
MNEWFVRFSGTDEAPLRLICFPHAGGTAWSFSHWSKFLPTSLELFGVQLPGHGSRVRESPIDAFGVVVGQLRNAIPPALTKPYAFFGHSMGALIAFELARRLHLEGLPPPAHLFVSGRRAPQFSGVELPDPAAPDDMLIDAVLRLGGTSPDVLTNQDLMELFLPVLRADLAVCRTYEYITGDPLPCEITAFGGKEDEEGEEEFLNGWQVHSSRGSKIVRFEGDHFYLNGAAPLVCLEIANALNVEPRRVSRCPLNGACND